MKKQAFVDQKLCDGLPACIVKFICPAKAVSQRYGLLGGTASVDAGKCTGCGKCLAACPHGALSLR
jgi:Fe-S-cluster-containing hydrogenase component 2